MRWFSYNLLGFCLLGFGLFTHPSARAADTDFKSPRLLFILIIDGLSYEGFERNLHRFSSEGFKELLQHSSQFTEAHYPYSNTFTAPGHATLLTGTLPKTHGIIGNSWHDNVLNKRVYATGDRMHPIIGEKPKHPTGGSPKNLLVPTLTDRMQEASETGSKTLAISIKDRAAILSAGAEGVAFFYGRKSGRFVSSEYYFEDFPEWWKSYYETEPQKNRGYDYDQLGDTSKGSEYLFEFAREAVRGYDLGKNKESEFPDTLILSISGHDYVNHEFGPESEESIVDLIRTNDALGEFLDFLENWVDPKEMLTVVTSDHGFSASPEACLTKNKEGGRLAPEKILRDLNHFYGKKYRVSKLAKAWQPQNIYLDQEKIRAKAMMPLSLEKKGKAFLKTLPGIAQVVTRTELMTHSVEGTWGSHVANGWHPERSGDFVLVQDKCWYLLRDPFSKRATHGSPYSYDTHVPLFIKGDGFPLQKFHREISLASVVPTLAYHLGVLSLRDMHSFDGEVLTELFQEG